MGKYDCELKEGTKAAGACGQLLISERHRHRYEFNNEYMERLEEAGMRVAGVNPASGLVR